MCYADQDASVENTWVILMHWVMFDIDGTLVDERGQTIDAAMELYHEFVEQGARVLIMTARPQESWRFTVDQLSGLGVEYDLLVFTPAENKTAAKRRLFRVPLECSVGDLRTDLGFSKYRILVTRNGLVMV